MPRSSVSKWLLAFGTLAAASCGGTTVDDAPGSGARSGVGGTGVAGSGGAAGGSGGGAGMPARCQLPAESGQCLAYSPSYFHNPVTGICEPFVYGGCGGNDNRFSTLAECQAACRGGSPDMDACEFSRDCALLSASCCGVCPDSAEARAFVALNSKHTAAFERTLPCGSTCGACPPFNELSSNAQYFAATCEAGQCTVVDIRETALTECGPSSQCTLRDGAGCCEDCDGQGIVAIRAERLQDMMCGAPSACPACAPKIPGQLVALCNGSRCAVTIPL